MDGQIVSRESIRLQAAAAAAAFDGGEHIDITNPYPSGTAAHALFQREFRDALAEIEAVPV